MDLDPSLSQRCPVETQIYLGFIVLILEYVVRADIPRNI